MIKILCLIFAVLISQLVAQTLTVPVSKAVAPALPGTVCQMWSVAAYSSVGSCWLVVWREGNINDLNTDIYCARIALDGSVLDPNGICLSRASDNQEAPSVATDGTDFFVAWQDFRNGNDFDVYGARVTSAGIVLDTAGILIAGGNNNQCRPSIVYSNNQYHVFWQGWCGDSLNTGYWVLPFYNTGAIPVGYQLFGTRVSSEGHVGSGSLLHGWTESGFPSAMVADTDVLVCFDKGSVASLSPTRHFPAILKVDGKSGLSVDSCRALYAGTTSYPTFAQPGAAYGTGCGIMVSDGSTGDNDLRITKFSNQGALLSIHYVNPLTIKCGLIHRQSIAFDGASFLVLNDFAFSSANVTQVQVRGLLLPGDGALTDTNATSLGSKMVAVSDNLPTRDQIQGFCAAGPTGSFLVTYSEVQGPDSIKVKAKVITYSPAASESSYLKSLHQLPSLVLSPNPFSSGVEIVLSGERINGVDIAIYDLRGRLVRSFVSNSLMKGERLFWDGKDRNGAQLVSGTYIVKCQTGTSLLKQCAIFVK